MHLPVIGLLRPAACRLLPWLWLLTLRLTALHNVLGVAILLLSHHGGNMAHLLLLSLVTTAGIIGTLPGLRWCLEASARVHGRRWATLLLSRWGERVTRRTECREKALGFRVH